MEFLSTIDGVSGDVVLKNLLAEHGPLEERRPVPEERAAVQIGRVPNLLIDLWRAHGVGAIRHRGLWLAMPGTLDGVEAAMFGGDPDLGGDTTIFAYGAMGNLLAWNERHGMVLVVLAGGAVQVPGLFRPEARFLDEAELLHYLRELDPFFFDRMDSQNKPMLESARDALGPLRAGQVYATYPVQALGAPIDVANVRIDDIADYLGSIATGRVFVLHDYETGRLNVREIGGTER